MGADISPDEKILAINYVDMNNIKPASKIVFMKLKRQKNFWGGKKRRYFSLWDKFFVERKNSFI